MAEAEEGMQREPCPWRILDDAGGAFAMGAIGGSVWHFTKGYRTSPAGFKFSGALGAMKTRAPVLGGSFGVWGGMFSTFDCTFSAIRGKEDPWNAIMSGAVTGGLLSARSGMKTSVQSAVFGGVILAVIEGIGIMLNRMATESHRPVLPELPPPPPAQPGGRY